MAKPISIKINKIDNVSVAVDDIPKGTQVTVEVISKELIPQGHKIALVDIPKSGEIIRYGTVLGYAKDKIDKGSWINETMLDLPTPPNVDALLPNPNYSYELPNVERTTFMGYENQDGYGGTRNILGISTTVQCVTPVLNVVMNKIKTEILPKYPNVDDVVAINHAYGCGVAINAPEAKVPIRTIANIIKNPNFGGEIMLLGLGCEKLTPEMLLPPELNNSENVLILQDYSGYKAMCDAIMELAEKKISKLNKRVRKSLPLNKLIVGMQCGGSDAFSGITANTAAGYATDMLVAAGATVLFSEVTEVRDGVEILASRTTNVETCTRLKQEMKWYDNYLECGGADRSANPTPGNKKGGLSNIVEKAMGSIAKSGSTPIVEVLSPGERPTKQGVIYASTPASDFVCGTCQFASGITLQVFMTGRGTPYGLAALPVIKLSSRSDLKNHWQDLIDFDAGVIATGEMSIIQAGESLFNMIIDTAEGKYKPYAEEYKLYNDICLFNPAPIT